ncbi:MAG: PKD domain-containing protein [Bacteroidetes bacterium]|nr:PKD domain-containing protein [Bacteroidota bacterium]
MTHLVMMLTVIVSIFFLFPSISRSQCAYDNTYYTTPALSCPGSATAACVFGGEYITVNVVAGNTYTFSTCGVAGFDTQLTLYQSGGGGSLAYSDDACGLQSSITWTATFTGSVDVLLDQYNCSNNATCQPIDIQCSAGGSPITASDCSQAVNVCTDLNFTIDPNGFGTIDEIPAPGSYSNPNVNPTSGNSGCLLSGEKNSTWMLVYISGTGNLEFTFGGNGTQSGYYDWIMYQWTPTICSDIPNNIAPPVRCNWNCTSSGGTGLASTIPAGGSACNYESPLPVTCGQQYVIVFSNWSSVTTTVPLQFGGTATVSCTPSTLNVTVTPASPVICSGGSVTLTASGATTYTWSPSTGLSSTMGSSVVATPSSTTTYTVTGVTGCVQGTATVTVTVTPSFTLSMSQVNPSCTGSCNGSATATPSGGNPAFTYSWSGGGATQTKTGMCAGTYTVTVTDASGCMNTATVTITNPPALSVSVTPGNTTCPGVCSGTLSASGSGGTPAYTYNWSGGLGSGPSKTGVCTGTYTVTITDSKGCTSTASGIVNQPPAISVTVTPTNESCDGGCNGSVTASASGGTGALTYSWCCALGTGATKSGLCDGTYTVTVTDANGCTATGTGTVNPGPVIAAGFTYNGNQCLSGNSFNFTNTGTMGVTYSWSFPSGSPSSSTLENPSGITWSSAGSYTVTQIVTSGSCMNTATLTITVYPQPSVALSKADITCNGLCNGTITANIASGTPPFTYSWSNGSMGSGTISSLCASSYTVTVTDAYGCSGVASATITQPPLLTVSVTPAGESCDGACDGSVTASASGGTGSLTYSWCCALGTGATKTGLCDGTYTVTVTDANGCTTTGSATVNPGPVITAGFTYNGNQCLTGNSFNFTNTGTMGVTYSWTFPSGTPASSTAENPSGITWSSAGSYTVTQTVTSGSCMNTATVTITVYPQPSVTINKTDISCNGLCNGSASANITSGTAPFTFSWSNGSMGTGTISSLCVNTYTVTVTDGFGCTATASATITQPALLSAVMSNTNATCNNVCNAMGNVTVSGGTPSYTYQWSAGAGFQTTSSATGLCDGIFSVTVTDSKGCTATGSVTVTEPAAMTVTVTTINSTCGASTGSVTATVGGGTSPYTYSWSNGCMGSNCTNLPAGNYLVTVTDAGGCTQTANGSVNDAGGISASVATDQNITCFGLCNGQATATVTGGGSPYTYVWSNGQTVTSAGTAQTQTGLCGGNISVTVTDASGCASSGAGVVTEPALLTGIATVTPESCGGSCNGTMSISMSGGLNPYTYSWPGGPTGPVAGKSSLCAGTLTVTVSDAYGCTLTVSGTVTAGGNIILSVTPADANCNNVCTGSANLTVTGGGVPLTYLWSNTFSGEDPSGLCDGTYTVTVTDANGCTASTNTTITEPAALTVSLSSTNELCDGLCDGTATATTSGGIPSYTYSWSGGGTGTTKTNLCDGTYTVTVTDSKGCTVTGNVTINAGPVITAGFTPSVNQCLTGNSFSFTNTGTMGVTYSWTFPSGTPSSSAIENPSGISWSSAGTYTITQTVTSGSCMNTATLNITVFAQPSVTISKSDLVCYNVCNGSMTATVSSGTSPFTYNWNTGCASSTCNSLCTGTYTVTVTDAKGCSATANTTITEPAVLTVITSSTPATCGQSNGTATATPSGGTGSYTYIWDDPAPVQTTQTAAGLAGGVYNVTVTDSKGCTVMGNVTVNSVAGGNVSVSILSNITCNGLCNGSATATMSGGTSPFTYQWNTIPAQNTATATGLCASTYTVTVTDASSCTGTASIILTQPAVLTASIGSSVNLSCYNTCTGSITVTAGGGTGSYSYQWNPVVSVGNNATGLCANTFNITVSDANGCSATLSQTLTQPSQLTVTTSGTTASCSQVCDGTSSATAGGGTPPYSYSWSNSSTGSTVTGLCGGSNVTVTVTDSKGCTATGSYSVPVLPDMLITTTSTDASCGTANGQVSCSVTNGTIPYTYIWSSGCITSSCAGLASGSYTVTATDSKGCTASGTATVSNMLGPTVILSGTTSPDCFGNCTGTATIIITDGISPYTTQWNTSPPQTSLTATGLCAATYVVTVTDANNCIATLPATITEPPLLSITSTTVTDISCYGQCTGSINPTITGGTPPYTYQWNSGQTMIPATGLCTGNYSLTVTDSEGCTASSSASITQPTQLFVVITSDSTTCSGQCNGSATAAAGGGTPAYTYLWSNGSTGPIAGNLCSGNYSVTVTDSKGCTATGNVSIYDPLSIIASIPSWGDVDCFGNNNGWAQSAATGGTPPYTYLWSDNQTGNLAVNLDGELIIVTITDVNGCMDSASVSIFEPPQLIVLVVPNPATCYGVCDGWATVDVVGGIPAYTYLWDANAQFQSTQMATGLCADNFTVTVTDNNGCSQTGSVIITEPQQLSFINDTIINSTCGNPNGGACISIIGGLAPYTAAWNTSPPATGLCVNNIYAGAYSPVVTDGNGCSFTAPVIINDIAGPTIDSVTGIDATCKGASDGAVFGYFSGGTSPYSYLWKESGDTISTGFTFVLGVPAGTYTFTVTDDNGCVSSGSVTIYEPSLLVSAILNVTNASCNGYCDGSVTAGVGGGELPYTFTWNITPQQDSTTATGLCAGTYNIVISDASGCSTTETANVSEPLPLDITPAVDSVNCAGNWDGTISLIPSPTGGTGPYSITWLPPGFGTGPVITNLPAATYTCIVTDSKNCSLSEDISVGQPAPLLIATTAVDAKCGNADGSAAVFPTGGTPAYTLLWIPGGYTTPIVNGLPSGNYTVYLSDKNGCTDVDTVTVNNIPGPEINLLPVTHNLCYGALKGIAAVNFISSGTPPYSFTWNPASPDNDTAFQLPSGPVIVTVTDFNSCTDIDTTYLTQPAPLSITITPDKTICYGQSTLLSVSMSGGTPQFTYSWDNSLPPAATQTVTPNVTTTYNVTITDQNGCQSDSFVIVTVLPPLDLDSQVVSICYGENAVFTATATGGDGGPYTYVWENGQPGSQFTIIVPPVNDTIYAYVMDGCSKNDTAKFYAFVNPLPVAAFSASAFAGCLPFPVTFTDMSTVNQGSIVSWDWDFGDLIGSSLQNPTHTYTSQGTFDVSLIVTTNAGCRDTVIINSLVSVYPVPDAFFTAKPDLTTLINATIQFDDGSAIASPGIIVTWSWDFGDPDAPDTSQTSLLQNPQHTYTDTGVFIITLTVTSDNGCTDIYVDSVEIENEYILFVPNAITPDGDGHNDYFFPEVIGLREDRFEMYIFDRWGDLIYETKDINKPWNGRANKGNILVQQDVYVWLIKTEDLNGVDHRYIGHVSVIK